MKAEEIGSHRLWDVRNKVLESLDAAEGDAPDDAQPYAERIRGVAGLITPYRDVSDSYANLLSMAMVDTVANHWDAVAAHVVEHAATPAGGHLSSTTASLDATLTEIARWPTVDLASGPSTAVFEAFQTQSQSTIDSLRERNESFKSVIAAQDELIAKLEARLASLDQKLTADETRLDTAITAHVTTFNESQTKRDQEFKAVVEHAEAESEAQRSAFTEQTSASRTEGEALLKYMEDLRDKTEAVAGEATSARLARQYGEQAAREYGSAKWAFSFGGALVVAALAFLWVALSSVEPSTDVSWQFTALKLTFGFTLGAVAAFAFNLGGRFLKSSSTNKRIEMELAAVVPFLADMERDGDDIEAVRQAKLAFVERTFGRTWDSAASDSKDSLNVDALSKAIESIKSLSSSGG